MPFTFKNEIVSFNDIAKRASIAFHENYSVDQEQEQTLFFISGSMDKSTFEKVLFVLKSSGQKSSSEPVQQQPLTNLYAKLLKNEYPGLVSQTIDIGWMYLVPEPNSKTSNHLISNGETIPMKDFLNGLVTSVQHLTQNKPGLRADLATFCVSPETSISLNVSLRLFVASPGFHLLGESYAVKNGKPVPMGTDNIGRFDLKD